MQSKSSHKKIIYLYIAALSIIALISTAFFIYINNHIATTKQYAKIINVSGKQRMLSQKTSLVRATYLSRPDNKISEKLRSLINEIKQDQEFLACENLQHINCNLRLDKEISRLLREHILVLEEAQENVFQKYIVSDLDFFLKALDERVLHFEKISKKENDKQIQYEKLMLLFILMTLVLEAIFIFRPAINSLIANIRKLEKKEKDLIDSLDEKNKILDDLSHELKTPLNELYGAIKEMPSDELIEALNKPYSKIEQAISFFLSFHKKEKIYFKEYTSTDYFKLNLDEDISACVHCPNESVTFLCIKEEWLNLINIFYQLSLKHTLKMEINFDRIIKFKLTGEKEALENVSTMLWYEQLSLEIEYKLLRDYLNKNDANIELIGAELIVKIQPTVLKVKNQKKIEEVLLVDDNSINLKVLERALEEFNFKITKCSDGDQAVYACQQSSFDLIFMDLRMPRMNGVEAIKKKLEIPNYQTHIIVVTANAFKDDKLESIRIGANSFVEKPISKHKIKDEVEFASHFYQKTKISLLNE